jgi:DnaJ-class molecular chaperone
MVMPIIQYAPETCQWCDGQGKWGEFKDNCHVCGGQGSVLVAQPSRKCPQCEGSGSVGDFGDPCTMCKGAGWSHVLPNQMLRK